LRSGIGYSETAELLKRAFVHESIENRHSRGRSTNLSRVAIRTGISRKEVARLRQAIRVATTREPSFEVVAADAGHAARVLQLWHSDPKFVDETGKPRDLSMLGDGVTFAALVKAAGRDVPPGAVRAELQDAGALVETGDGLLRPTSRHFVPADVGEDLILGLTHFVMPVLAGVDRNTDGTRRQPFVQRLAYSDAIGPHELKEFRHVSRRRALEFVQSIDDWLLAHETNPENLGSERRRVSLGVFYYEGDLPIAADSRDDPVSDNITRKKD